MNENLIWGAITLLCSGLSAFAGAVAKAYGDRLRTVSEAEKRREARDLSEMDLWARLGAMEERVQALNKQLAAMTEQAGNLKAEVAELRAENRLLRLQQDEMSKRYDRLRESHDSLLRGGPPVDAAAEPQKGAAE